MTLDDAPAVQKHFGTWNVIKQIGSGGVSWPYPADGAERYLASVLEDGVDDDRYLWALTSRDDLSEAIGAIEYRLAPGETDNRGFWLAEPFWGRGLMTEAVIATQDYVFFELNADRVVVRNAVSNAASRAVKEKCGARLLGREPQSYLSGDESQEVWEVLRVDWESKRNDPSLRRYRR